MGNAAEERAVSEVKRLCCAGRHDGLELLDEAIGRLRRVVPFEAYCASTKDPASGFITHAVAEEMGGADAFWMLERVYFDHHSSVRRMADTRRPVALLSETTGGYLERSLRYVEYLRPLGLVHEVRGAFTSGGYLWGSMDLTRGSGSADFAPRETELLRRIAPHLGNGLRMAALRLRLPATGPGGPDSPGMLTLDHRGRVVQHTPSAERWLRDLEDLGPRWREWDCLPRAVRTAVLLLRRALSPERDRDDRIVPSLHARARSGRWLTLYGSLTEATPERRAETAIIIESTKPEALLPFSMAAYGLSPREREVVKLIVRGLSSVRVSRELFISEYTVQNHLRSIYEKVGVRSRGELVRRLFFDNLYPTLLG